mgnify:CR=1 FL=1
MLKNTAAKIAILTGTLTLAAAAQAAPITIDDFTDGQVLALAEAPASNTLTETIAGGMLGGFRTLVLTANDNGDIFTGNFLDVNVNAGGNGALVVSNGTGVHGEVLSIWDAAGAGLGGEDITAGGLNSFITMDVLTIDLGVSVEFTLEDTSGNSFSVTDAFSGPGIFQSDLAAFTGVDSTSIDSIQMRLFSRDSAWDGAVDFVETNTRVPEPTAIALLGLGISLLGFQTAARRKKQA